MNFITTQTDWYRQRTQRLRDLSDEINAALPYAQQSRLYKIKQMAKNNPFKAVIKLSFAFLTGSDGRFRESFPGGDRLLTWHRKQYQHSPASFPGHEDFTKLVERQVEILGVPKGVERAKKIVELELSFYNHYMREINYFRDIYELQTYGTV